MSTTEMTATSVITLFDTNKEQRMTFVKDFLRRVYEGAIDPIHAHYCIKCMEDIIKGITSDSAFKDLIVEAAEKYGRKFEYNNSVISIRETGVKYDYSLTGDPLIAQLHADKKQLDDKIKAREEFLKKIPLEGMEVVVADEVVRCYPPSKSSTTTAVVTLN